MTLPSPIRVPIKTEEGDGAVGDGRTPFTSSSSSLSPPPPSRCSLEFACMVIPLLCICAYGTYCPMRASYLAYDQCKGQLDKPDLTLHALSRGIIRGYDVEGDAQWRSYAHFTPLFIVLFALVGTASRVLRFCRRRVCLRAGASLSPSRSRRAGSSTYCALVTKNVLGQWWSLPLFHVIVGVIFVAVLHGPHFVFTIVAALVNYVVFRALQDHVPYWVFALIMWTSHVAFLYVAEAYDGFERFYWVQYWLPSSRSLASAVLPPSMHETAVPLWGTIMRWQQLARMSTLRMIAFNYDHWEASHAQQAAQQRAVQKHRETCLECARLRQANGAPPPRAGALLVLREEGSVSRGSGSSSSRVSPHLVQDQEAAIGKGRVPTPLRTEEIADSHSMNNANNNSPDAGNGEWHESLCCYKFRTEFARDASDYNLLNYLAFLFFAPLYLAGPMMSFNAFVSFLKHPTRAVPLRAMTRYIVNILVVFGMAYLTLHLVYVHTLAADLAYFKTLPIQAQALLLYWYLTYLWLKFAFLWRTSRLYAVWSGIEPPEDMRRCFSDTLTIQDFWRDWHASFNLWIVRYMYIPMGGRARITHTLWPIFFFIAIWHDHRLHLLQWALLIVVSFMFELGSHAIAARYVVKPVQVAMASLSSSAAGSTHGPRGASSAAPRWAARLATRILSWHPSTRDAAWRAVRGVAGAVTILTLITINLIGFLVQFRRSSTAPTVNPRDKFIADGKHSQTDQTVAEILFTREHALFAMCVVMVMVIVGVHNTFYRDRRARLDASERSRLRAEGQLVK